MGHWELGEKDFHNWAVKKIANVVLLEEKEEWVDRYPPDELKHIYKVLDEQVAPILAQNGIPISRKECFKMFRSWFVKANSPTRVKQPRRTTLDDTEPRISILEYPVIILLCVQLYLHKPCSRI